MSNTARSWRTPAVVIVAGCLIAMISYGVRSGFGLYLAPMSADLGWGREVFGLAVAIQNLIWGFAMPFAGAVADRYGTARVLAVGGLFYAGGVYLMSESSTPGLFHISAGLLVGLGLAGTSFTLILAAFARMVSEEKRSWAMGIGTAAGSLGQVLLVPMGQAFLAAYGWSLALALFGLLALMIVPLSSALKGRGEVFSRGPAQSLGSALKEAGGHSGYLYLTAGFFVCGFHVTFIGTHLPAYVTDLGLDPSVGAWALSLVGLFNIAGAYMAGVLGDRFSKKYILSLIYLGRAVVIMVFVLMPPSAASVLIFASVLGLLWLSTVPVTTALVAQMLGVRYLATLSGLVFLSHQLGSFLGVWLGGYLFDRTGSYDVVWWLGVALGLFAALIHLPIDERPAARLTEAANA